MKVCAPSNSPQSGPCADDRRPTDRGKSPSPFQKVARIVNLPEKITGCSSDVALFLGQGLGPSPRQSVGAKAKGGIIDICGSVGKANHIIIVAAFLSRFLLSLAIEGDERRRGGEREREMFLATATWEENKQRQKTHRGMKEKDDW